MAATAERLILASASMSRAQLLRSAGIEFAIEPAAIDESRLKHDGRRRGDTAIACASALAAEKAKIVSRRHRDALVIGADQILAVGEEWFDKPVDLAEARRQLLALRGRTHRLETAAVVMRDAVPLWHAASGPELEVRWFGEVFLDEYLAAEGEALLGSVGAYRLEGRGVQLFSRINGDHFAVLGLPLIELLDFLRERGVITN
jgi:septum formation protein